MVGLCCVMIQICTGLICQTAFSFEPQYCTVCPRNTSLNYWADSQADHQKMFPTAQSLLTHGQCDARPTVTFLALEHDRRSTCTTLYCLVTEAGVCEQLVLCSAMGES